jgi:hypothetical protein
MRLTVWLSVAALLVSAPAVAGELQTDLQARRGRLASSLDGGTYAHAGANRRHRASRATACDHVR